LKKNLVLTGMMGVGKSSVGEDLSRKLNTGFKDIDKIIETKLSLSITDIFEKKGEKFFREIEEKETLIHLKDENIVIALGGGAFMNEKIRENIKKFSVSFWLDLNNKQVFQRVSINKKRPLLSNKSTEKDVEKLYEKRKDIYSLADYRINCNFKNKNEIVKEILKIYENI
tara:strand:+ start:355 stop:864 length:510 start_codon:yes stop_codon:yes gene_type:complete